jgi:hypothetical protein
MSTGSCLSSTSNPPPGGGGYSFKIPEKLQIVKPMEGSMTLHQWQRLATPHLGGFLEDRPGVQIKGERKVDFGDDLDNYSITDFEEDDGKLTSLWSKLNDSMSVFLLLAGLVYVCIEGL